MNMDRLKYRYWEHEVWNDPTSPLVAKYTDIVAGCDPTVAVFDFEFCTGLKDKNGNLIYEGDILEISMILMPSDKHKAKVWYNEKKAVWELYHWDRYRTTLLSDYLNISQMEIVGNIHKQKDNK